MLLAGCDGGQLLAWNAALDQVTVVDRLERAVDAVRLAPAGPARLAIAAGKLLRVYPLPASGPPDSRGGKTLVTLGAEAGLVVKLAWSPDGRQLAYGTSEGRVATIDAASGATIKTFPKHAREVAGIVWSSAGRTLVTADAESVRFSDVATTMTFDELRPGWIIEDMDFVGAGGAGTSPLLVIAGSVPAASGGNDREARLGLFDLRHSLTLNEVQR
jgi:WD40 repeat protein